MANELDSYYKKIIKNIGEDPGRDGLLDTPGRAARAMQYLTRGYGQSLDEVVNNAIFESDNDSFRWRNAKRIASFTSSSVTVNTPSASLRLMSKVI